MFNRLINSIRSKRFFLFVSLPPTPSPGEPHIYFKGFIIGILPYKTNIVICNGEATCLCLHAYLCEEVVSAERFARSANSDIGRKKCRDGGGEGGRRWGMKKCLMASLRPWSKWDISGRGRGGVLWPGKNGQEINILTYLALPYCALLCITVHYSALLCITLSCGNLYYRCPLR